ncbi:MAG TPA: DNA polymerase IV [Candidatus Limnocylindrales bacterium]|nr:DNA polymerase IV [Candidatus Limnocylindrales bacterium]
MAARTILHVDLDAFFAAVEQRDRPELRGRPVVVGGGGGEDARGVVSAASYEARVFGIHSAMSLREAYRRCPDAVFLPVDGRRYQAASREVMSILRRYTPQVEPISIDEAFLDVTGSFALFGDGPTIAQRIKDDIRAEVGLTASVGVAGTKLVAKVASDLRKPDGLVVVPTGDEAAFLAPLPIGRLWGVGDKTAVALREYSVRTIGDLAALPPDLLVRRFGKHGASLVDRARGIDPDPVHDGDPAKSVGHEHTFEVDTSDPEVIERTLLAMSDGVAGRLRSAGVRAGTVAVKIRDSGFRTITRQRTLPEPTDLTGPIYATALDLARPEIRGMRVRLLGVTASNLGEREQLSLFESDEPRHRRAIEAADALRRRYGERAVTRARLLGAGLPAPFERDPRNPLDRRARGLPVEVDGAAAADGEDRDSQADTTLDDIPSDEA